MNYKNAADILPPGLLREVQCYIQGEILYIPRSDSKQEWGAVSGSKNFYLERNFHIRELFQNGISVEELAVRYGVSSNTIKKIVYHKKK